MFEVRMTLAVILSLLMASPAAADPTPSASPGYTIGATSCAALAPAVRDLARNTAQAITDASNAGTAAQNLSDKRSFKVIEDSATSTRTDVLQAYAALGPVETAEIPDPRVILANRKLIAEFQGDLQTAQLLTQLALAYERTDNAGRSRRRKILQATPFILVAPFAAAGYMGGVAGTRTTTSTTTGTVGGEPFSESTTTLDNSRAEALNSAVTATQVERLEALQLYTPQVGNLIYAAYPVVRQWSAACGASARTKRVHT